MLCRVLQYLAAETGDNSPANDEHAPRGTRRRHRGHLVWYAAWKEWSEDVGATLLWKRLPSVSLSQAKTQLQSRSPLQFKPAMLTTVFGSPHIDLRRA